MSIRDVLAPSRSAESNPGRSRRPSLRLVPRAPAAAPRMPFVLLVLTVLGVGLVGLLLLNTQLQQGSFALHDLERRNAALTDRESVLDQQVAQLESSNALALKARTLGMVPNLDPAFLQLEDGSVLGDPSPAEAPSPPPVSESNADEAGAGTEPGSGEQADGDQADGDQGDGEQEPPVEPANGAEAEPAGSDPADPDQADPDQTDTAAAEGAPEEQDDADSGEEASTGGAQ